MIKQRWPEPRLLFPLSWSGYCARLSSAKRIIHLGLTVLLVITCLCMGTLTLTSLPILPSYCRGLSTAKGVSYLGRASRFKIIEMLHKLIAVFICLQDNATFQKLALY